MSRADASSPTLPVACSHLCSEDIFLNKPFFKKLSFPRRKCRASTPQPGRLQAGGCAPREEVGMERPWAVSPAAGRRVSARRAHPAAAGSQQPVCPAPRGRARAGTAGRWGRGDGRRWRRRQRVRSRHSVRSGRVAGRRGDLGVLFFVLPPNPEWPSCGQCGRGRSSPRRPAAVRGHGPRGFRVLPGEASEERSRTRPPDWPSGALGRPGVHGPSHPCGRRLLSLVYCNTRRVFIYLVLCSVRTVVGSG